MLLDRNLERDVIHYNRPLRSRRKGREDKKNNEVAVFLCRETAKEKLHWPNPSPVFGQQKLYSNS